MTTTKTPTKGDLLEQNSALLETVELFVERLAELELALDDVGWIQMSIDGQAEFSNAGLSKIITLARLAYLKNPLINRAANVQAHYVFGQGMNIEATPNEVDPVVQAFLDHPKNEVELTGHQARTMKEITLQLEANLFLVLFTNSSSGRVIVRKIPVDEVLAGDIICNPDDRKEPWFYKRVWTQRTFQISTGETSVSTMTAYYPDWRYKPASPGERIDVIKGDPVHWDQPVMHVKVGGLDDMRFGVPEVYSALDWAKAVTKDLERYATLRASLARFAWFMAQKSTKGIDAAKRKLGTTLGIGTGVEDNPPPIAGSMFIGLEGTKPEPIRTAGMTPSPDDGRRLGLMVAAGTGIPETMLFGDADVGNLATSKTLDRPTELKMLDRQTLWADIFKGILSYVVEQAASRANGPLEGIVTVEADEDDAAIVRVKAANGDLVGYEVTFPEILERSVTERVDAIVKAVTLGGLGTPAGTLDPRTAVGLLLRALGLDDIDELLDDLVPQGTTWEELRPEPATPPAIARVLPGQQPQLGPGQQQDQQVAEALRDVRSALVELLTA